MMETTARPRLDVSPERQNGTLRLVLKGQLVGATIDTMNEAIAQAMDASPSQVRLDMENLTQIDSRGIGLLVSAYRKMAERGITIQLNNLTPSVERTLRICNLYDLLDAGPSPEGEPSDAQRRLRCFSYAQQLMACMGDGLVGLSPDGQILFVNEKAEAILGRRESELLGRACFESLSLIDEAGRRLARTDCPIMSIASGTKQYYNGELWVADHQDRMRPIQINAVRIADGDTILGIIAGIRDLTDRERARQAMLKSARLEATTTLAGGLAHDLNNLMFVVLGATELLKQDLKHSPIHQPRITQIQEAGQRASELASLILAYAQGGKNQARRMNLNQAVERALKEVTIRPEIHVICDLDRNLRLNLADPFQMDQLLRALLENAAEAITADGTIRIATHNFRIEAGGSIHDLPPGYYVRLRVEDSGMGMSPHALERAFEPFFTTKMIGRGMGLAAAHGIALNHHGAITLDSTEGKGTRAEVLLPAALFKKIEPEPETVPTASPFAPSIALLQEDEMQRLATQVVLERQGYSVLALRWLPDVLELIRTHPGGVQLAILDLDDMNECPEEVYRALAGIMPGIRLVFSSQEALDEDTLAMPATVLPKPYGSDDLLKAIRQALKE